MEVGELVEADLWSLRIEHEPPSIACYRSETNVCTNNHVAKEQPASNKWLITLTWLTLHDGMVRWIEGECCCWETISDEVDPEKLDWNESFWHADGCCEEDRDNFADIGGDEIANELLSVVVD